MERQLADLRGEVAALRAALAEGTWGAQPDLAALREGLLGLEKQVGRAGREQLKVNSIAEAQSGQLAAALEQMRAADARREAELAALRERSRGAQATARMEVVQNILPALDGLDEALRGGRAGAGASEEPEQDGWLRRLLGGPAPRPSRHMPDAGARQAAELRAAIESWLAGLTFVRQRLLDVLKVEGVRPTSAVGQPFDPNYHVAIGVVPATESHPPGVVVEELRRGYLAGERPLRHAEVVVAAGEESRQEREQEGEPT